MARDHGPHVVARASLGAKREREVEVRPTCKVDSKELLGLVGRTNTELPRRSKPQTDLDVEIVAAAAAEPMVPARSSRVVQTVRRAEVPKPVVPVAAGSDVAIPVVEQATPATDDDPFVDLFSDPTRVARAPTATGEEAPLEAHVPTELPPISIKLPSPLTPVRAPKRRFAPSLVQQIAIGVVLGCVGIGVYLGIVAT